MRGVEHHVVFPEPAGPVKDTQHALAHRHVLRRLAPGEGVVALALAAAFGRGWGWAGEGDAVLGAGEALFAGLGFGGGRGLADGAGAGDVVCVCVVCTPVVVGDAAGVRWLSPGVAA